MKSPLEQLSDLEDAIRTLHKISSKLYAGQTIPAYRELGSLLATFEQAKRDMIQEAKARQAAQQAPQAQQEIK